MRNPCLEALKRELVAAGMRHVFLMRGKHCAVRFGPSLERIRFFATTPSDRRASLNERAAVRRAIAELRALQ